jgi:hypothetical protein
MRRRDGLFLLAAMLSGCAPTAEQQAAALSPTVAASVSRGRQSRRFDTTDQMLMLRAAIGTLQDLGYTIEESQAGSGIIVGSKLAATRVRAQIVVQPAADRKMTAVRATFQTITPRPGAMLAIGEELDSPELYRVFFEKLSQSVFLTAHEI